MPQINTRFWIFLVTTFSWFAVVQSAAIAQQISDESTIRIGFLVSEDPDTDSLSREAMDAAQFAVDEINNEGGIDGKKVKLITRISDGDWGASSLKSVELIYDEEVHAIVGSLDGRDAHLVQMAIAKAHIIYLETRATDPTLSEANLPWFFRVLPSDRQQGQKLISEIFIKRDLSRIALIHADDYEEEMAANMFLRLLRDGGHPEAKIFAYDYRSPNFEEITEYLGSSDEQGVLYFGKATHFEGFMKTMNDSKIDLPVFSPLAILQTNNNPENVTFVCPELVLQKNESSFKESFKQRFGYDPGTIGAYSYDGVGVLLEAIRQSGTETESLQKELSGISFSGGITGQIEFDENGDIVDKTTICN